MLGRVETGRFVRQNSLRAYDPTAINYEADPVQPCLFGNHLDRHSCAAEDKNGAISPQSVAVHLRQASLPVINLRLDRPLSAEGDHTRGALEPTSSDFQRTDTGKPPDVPFGSIR
ncbi:hypothetical protein IU470_13105 [Nocardia abscessus]|uniref:Uncharacterized protein n=1 Tax=Nocardia abscessus TaxID=120957 RepID=A0ABS0CCA3_9NOCA|nr:hypothetical protein [Nocardia abscessus]MBF6226033.1 hypothetical protein [Nocardia abscessus]